MAFCWADKSSGDFLADFRGKRRWGTLSGKKLILLDGRDVPPPANDGSHVVDDDIEKVAVSVIKASIADSRSQILEHSLKPLSADHGSDDNLANKLSTGLDAFSPVRDVESCFRSDIRHTTPPSGPYWKAGYAASAR